MKTERRHFIAKSVGGSAASFSRRDLSWRSCLSTPQCEWPVAYSAAWAGRACAAPALTLADADRRNDLNLPDLRDLRDCETPGPVQMSNMLSVVCQVTGEFARPEQSMVSNDGDWSSRKEHVDPGNPLTRTCLSSTNAQ